MLIPIRITRFSGIDDIGSNTPFDSLIRYTAKKANNMTHVQTKN